MLRSQQFIGQSIGCDKCCNYNKACFMLLRKGTRIYFCTYEVANTVVAAFICALQKYLIFQQFTLLYEILKITNAKILLTMSLMEIRVTLRCVLFLSYIPQCTLGCLWSLQHILQQKKLYIFFSSKTLN